MSLRGAERRSNPNQRRDCRALQARNDCNDNYFVFINWSYITNFSGEVKVWGKGTAIQTLWGSGVGGGAGLEMEGD